MNERNKVAKCAELKCCQALVRYKQDWDSHPQSDAPPSLCISCTALGNEKTGAFYIRDTYKPSSEASARGFPGVAEEAVREYTVGKLVGESKAESDPPQESPVWEMPPHIRMARIMYLLNLLFQVEVADEKGDMKVELFENSFPPKMEARKADNDEFRRLMENRPCAEKVLEMLKREAEAF